MAQHIMLLGHIKEQPFLFFEPFPCSDEDILTLIARFENISLSSSTEFENKPITVKASTTPLHCLKSFRMSSSPMIVRDSMGLFAEHVQFLTSFNPNFHLDDSYLQVNHPERVEGLFSRRYAQLPIVGENSPLNMDPINWKFMYRPNRPFHFITNKHLRQSIPKLPPRPWLDRPSKKKTPTAYYLQQMELHNAPPPPPAPEVDEIADPADDVVPAGPLKVLVKSVVGLLASCVWMIVMLLAFFVVGAELAVGKVVGEYQKRGGLKWEILLFAVVAGGLVRVLPGMEGEGKALVTEVKGDAPLYVIMMRNPNQFRKFELSDLEGTDDADEWVVGSMTST